MNVINWFEIPVADFQRARQFYQRILDTDLKIEDSFGVKMAIFPHAGTDVGGCLIQFDMSKPHQDGVRIYLNGGDDLSKILDRVPGAGGQIVMPKKFLSEQIGYIGMFSDSEGNVIGLHSLH